MLLREQFQASIVSFILLTVITGVMYPLLVTAIANGAFSKQAAGSLIEQDGKVVGSSLIGQGFDDPKYFWGRLSATGPGYNASSSSGSNLGPLNPALQDNAKARIKALRDADPAHAEPVPVDLVTSSGSGLDPHISPAGAAYQISRVARARGLSEEIVRGIVRRHTTDRFLGLLGEPVVNVLETNLALDNYKK